MNNEYFPVVVQAVPGDDFTVYAYFSDGTIHLYDMKKLICSGGVFEQLKDQNFFRTRLTVMNDTIAWDVSGVFDATKCIDIDPFDVYESARVNDPLEVVA